MIAFEVVKESPTEFWLEVSGRTYRVPEGWKKNGELQSFTKHSTERHVPNLYGHDGKESELNADGTPKGNHWPTSPWIVASDLAYPVSSLAAALEAAEPSIVSKGPGRHFPVLIGGWELGIDSRQEPWCVFHALYRE